MFNFVVSTVTADDLAPLGAGSSADTTMTIYVTGTWKHLLQIRATVLLFFHCTHFK